MTLDYKKLFRWQETSSQGSFHVGMDRQPLRDWQAGGDRKTTGLTRFGAAKQILISVFRNF